MPLVAKKDQISADRMTVQNTAVGVSKIITGVHNEMSLNIKERTRATNANAIAKMLLIP